MMRGWTGLVVAAMLAAVIGLAALTHTHEHASAQGRTGPSQQCVFCQQTAAPGPIVAALVALLVPEDVAPALPPSAPALVTLVVHPGRGPPSPV